MWRIHRKKRTKRSEVCKESESQEGGVRGGRERASLLKRVSPLCNLHSRKLSLSTRFLNLNEAGDVISE